MEFHQEQLATCDAVAAHWDQGVGTDGNKYWKRLQEPALRRMIDRPGPDSRALDLATGNGLGARWLAGLGYASVLATDGSAVMLRYAEQRHRAVLSDDLAARIKFRQLDVTSPAAFDALLRESEPADGFDTILVNMALMDISDIEPLAQALPKLLKPDGVFVATVLHPVFFTANVSRQIDIDSNRGTTEGPLITRAKVIREYLDVPPYKGVAFYGQPAQQVYFHRPIHQLLGTFLKAGLVVDAIEEPAFSKEDHEPHRIESSANYTQLPAILAFRLRRRAV